MIDRRTISLINGEVDGINTPEESATLREVLAQEPEAQKLLVDLQRLARGFSSMSPVDPPAGLKQHVMRSIHARRAPAMHAGRKFNLLDFLLPARSFPRLGFVFSGGVLAGIALVVLYFTVVSHPSIDDRDASGTILGASESFQTADNATISTDGVEGQVVTEYGRTVSMMRVNLTMEPDLSARFIFDPGDARLRGISMADDFPGTLTRSDGLIEMGHGGGSFRAFFATGGSPARNVRFQVISRGNVLYERSFPLGKVQ